ncbi:hypothetical protein ELQ92_00745 [Labedella populi]|uniref:Helix-turn-helix domain-containing protein n=1 Tax=Labedella populi TaxID=2498850 RepID=A0A3S4AFX3_9MICO|nr:hypothetical protein [Labedella populi]RWZ67833.1 hypothetical protein ELQ92_00745 [Labedella populi]
MVLTVDTLDVLTALVILGGAAAVVVAAILVGQHLERRQDGDAVAGGVDGEPAVGPVASGFTPATLSEGEAAITDEDTASRPCGPLFIMAGAFVTSSVQPWRPAPARDPGPFATQGRAVSHEWIEPESDGLVELYRVGFLLDELAEELDIGPCSIVEELARRVFGATEPVADPLARRFGQSWTDAELRTLHSAVDAGHAVPEIARQLGRDQLSVVFRVLEAAAESRGTGVDETSVVDSREAALRR